MGTALAGAAPFQRYGYTTWIKPRRLRGNELDMKSDKNTRK